MNGEQIGYVSALDAVRMADEIDQGQIFNAEIAFINGGDPERKTTGVVIRVAVPEAKSVGTGST